VERPNKEDYANGFGEMDLKECKKCAVCGSNENVEFVKITDCNLCEKCDKKLADSFESAMKVDTSKYPEL